QQISVIGQIATEPKLFTPEGGVQFCSFRLASTERRYDADRKEWTDRETNWFTGNAFRHRALNAKESFRNGDRAVVAGRPRVRAWENGEKRGTAVEIDADGFGHDLRWGTSKFTKRDLAASASSPAADEQQALEEPSPRDPQESHGTDGPGREPDDGFIPNV